MIPGITDVLAGERLAELLSVAAEAPDFASAASFLLEQLANAAGATRGVLLALDARAARLTTAVTFGDVPPIAPVPLDDLGHPLAVAARSLCPVVSTDGAMSTVFVRWMAVPLPQSQFTGAPEVLDERAIAALRGDGFAVHTPSGDDRRRVGHAPLGVALLEVPPEIGIVNSLARAAMLAGPVLSRMVALDEVRRSAARFDRQRDRLSAVIDALPDPVVITDARANAMLRNRRAAQLLVATEGDDAERRRTVDMNHMLFTSLIAQSGAREEAGPAQLRLVDPGGFGDLLFEATTHPIAGADEEPSFVTVLRDVTVLREAAGELERQVQRVRLAEVDARRERDRLNLILENVADPIIVTDAHSEVVLMNRQAEQLFGIAERTGTSAVEAVRGNEATFTAFIMRFTAVQDAARGVQMRLVHPETGMDLPVEVVSGKIPDARGETLAVVSVLHDLRQQAENEQLYQELKRFSAQLEERIRAATADLGEQNKRLQWQARELERANRLKSDFLASISHELRTPINALIGYTSLLLDRIYGDINPKQEDGLRRIMASSNHLLALINDILDLAKIEAGKMPLHLEPVAIRHVVSEVAQQLEPLVRKKALEFRCELPDDAPDLFTDRTKVKQILINLLSNAIKFTHEGHVTLRVSRAGDALRFEVEDTGIGITEADLDAIWEDFRQVDQSRTREFGGTGLGLSITRKLVDQLGGTIGVQSTYGQGSTFSVTLPLRTVPRVVEAPAEG